MDDEKIKQIRSAGLDKEADRVSLGFCPLCGKPVTREEFRDPLSLREFGISGICQKDQDKFFGEDQ